MDNFKKESERIADICFMLHKREIEARKKEHDEFLRKNKVEKDILTTQQKQKEKITEKEEQLIFASKHYKNIESVTNDK
jgi:hypothetical protein